MTSIADMTDQQQNDWLHSYVLNLDLNVSSESALSAISNGRPFNTAGVLVKNDEKQF